MAEREPRGDADATDAVTVEAERALAAQTAAPEAVDSPLVGPFQGFARGREYTLANGQVWRQVDNTQLSGVSDEAATAQIRPARLGGWWLKINTYNTRARVERVR